MAHWRLQSQKDLIIIITYKRSKIPNNSHSTHSILYSTDINRFSIMH